MYLNSEVISEQHYYPFGLTLDIDQDVTVTPNPYQYNGKELERHFGLESYEYGARMMDPQLGMWHTVDPMAEKYYSLSPYNYAGDNPVNIVDPNGMDIVNFSGGTTYTGQDARNFFQSTKDVFQDNPETIEGSNKQNCL